MNQRSRPARIGDGERREGGERREASKKRAKQGGGSLVGVGLSTAKTHSPVSQKSLSKKIFQSSSLKMKRTSSSSDLAADNTVKKIKQSVTMSSTDTDAAMDGKPAAEGECCAVTLSFLVGQCSQHYLDTIISFVLHGCQQRNLERGLH